MSYRLLRRTGLAATIALMVALFAPVPVATAAETTELVIMVTTDIHGNIYPWDYYKNGEDDDVGLAKLATLVEQVRAEHPNSLLLDCGDLIQGAPLAYYYAKVEPLQDGTPHPLIAVMNAMGYDAAVVGNHEFNYGIPFLAEVIDDAAFPFLSANIYKDGTTTPYYTPYVIQDVTLDTGDTLKVGVIGFTPPGIVIWDRANVEGILTAGDIVEAANRFVPEMKAAGAQVIIALSHSGTSGDSSYGPEVATENASLALADVAGIDVVVAGHSHSEIPGKAMPDPVVGDTLFIQPGFWGNKLGVATLGLQKVGSGWSVTARSAELLSTKGSAVPADQAILDLAREAHDKTVAYVTGGVGQTQTAIQSHFSRLADTAAMQLINDVQMARVREVLAGTEYEGLPILSAAAPFKYGRGGGNDFTDIEPGPVSIADVASLYIYDNTLKAIKITGADLDGYLEHSAQNFLQVTPDGGYQPILDPNWRGYNFDQIDGIEYEIDITKPVGERIDVIYYNGQPVAADDLFILATNNYRAGGGGGFPGTGGDAVVVYDQLEESRQLIIEYLRAEGTIAPYADHNWRIKHTFLNHWAANYAYELLEREVVKGDETGQFQLNERITRAEFATLLVRALGLPMDVESAGFADVAGHWSEGFVNAAFAAGVVNGVATGQFAPDATISRQDAATMLVRARTHMPTLSADDTVLDRFSDADQVAAYAIDPLAYVVERGVFSGDEKGLLRPLDAITRAEAFKIIALGTPEQLPPDQVKITLINLNDFHGWLEQDSRARPGRQVGAARLTTAFLGEEWGNPGAVILAGGGDMMQGTTISNLVEGESVMEWLNLIDMDVMAIGNHEFDWTVEVLQERIDQAEFPVLAANLYDEVTGERLAWTQPTAFIYVKGVKVGLIGLATPESKTIVLPANVAGIEFRDPEPIVEQLVPQLRAQGADLVILVTHLFSGTSGSTVTGEVATLLENLDVDVDAVISGHSHAKVAGYVNGVPVLQGGSFGSSYAKLELVYDRTSDEVVRTSVEVVTPSQSLSPDPETEALVAKWREVIGPKVNEVIGNAATAFTRTVTAAGESVLGDMIADSQRWKTGADIGIMNGGGIRTDMEAGEVTWGEFYAVQPFGNMLYTLEMTGAEVKQVLEEGVDIFYRSINSLPGGHAPIQVSGLSFTWDYSKPFGERIDPASIILEDGSVLDLTATYTVSANEFIATGGDDLDTFGAVPASRKTYTGIVDLDAFIEWFEAQVQPVSYELQNRITVLNRP